MSPRAQFQCSKPGCPETIPKRGRCDQHQRPDAAARGYAREHRITRAGWVERVQAGVVKCWRCRELIKPDDEWHLGHDDHRVTRGPEHARACNLRTAGRNSHID